MFHDWYCMTDVLHIHIPFLKVMTEKKTYFKKVTTGEQMMSCVLTRSLIMGHVLDCTQQQRCRLSHTPQSASRECPNGAVWYMTREWAAFHTLDFFMPLDGFTSRQWCEAPVSTFTTIIPFISIKVSITGQRWDQINGPWLWNTGCSYSEKRKRRRGQERER